MADFQMALSLLLLNYEGVYSNHPSDPGGETYCGIARNHWPGWGGWKLIDTCKDEPERIDHEKLARHANLLAPMVKTFYFDTFWRPISGNDIDRQTIADELFEQAVNMGVSRASLHLQEALNLLNRNRRLWNDLTVDGCIGPVTLGSLNACLVRPERAEGMVLLLNGLQMEHYLNLMRRDPEQEEFALGWIKRASGK